MTQRTVNVLGVTLVLQVVLIGAAAYLSGSFTRDEESASNLVPLSADQIKGLTVEDGDGNHATLAEVDGNWQLPDYFGMPVDEHKRSDVLTRLLGAKATWPVATTASAAKRFKVAADSFERHVVFEPRDGDAVELYLGTSPGFRRVHARLAASNDIYAIEFSNYELPARDADWMDKALVTPKGKITNLTGDDWTLSLAKASDDDSSEAPKWTLEDAAEGETLDTSAVQNLVSAIGSLRVESVASDDEVAKIADAKPTFSLTVTTESGERYAYGFFTTDGGYLLRTERQKHVFKVPKYTGDRLNVPREKLLKRTQEAEAAPETQPEGSG